jgi:hypothetical protein
MNCYRFGPLSSVPLDLEDAVGLVIFVLVYPVCGVSLDDTGEPVVVNHLPLPPPRPPSPAFTLFILPPFLTYSSPILFVSSLPPSSKF